jgi:hypothetical protein
MMKLPNLYDNAVIGIGEQHGMQTCIVYDADEVIQTLVRVEGMHADEAREYAEFNIFTAYVGDRTPIFVYRMGMEEIEEMIGTDEVSD